MSNIRTYSELITLDSFDERFDYLKIGGVVGQSTFGFERYLNQKFYHSSEWRRVRDLVITRDLGCDLGVTDREIVDRIYIHHMNPMKKEKFNDDYQSFLNPEFLISCSFDTHQAIHYGLVPKFPSKIVCRSPNDTCLWKD